MTPQIRPDREHAARPRGFTLVELLVVIAMIALLISIVIFSVGTLQQTSKGMTCLNQQRQIMLAWDGYATDNAGRYVAPDTNRHAYDWVRSVGANLGPGNTEREGALTEGRLWPYLNELKLYRSPLDQSDHLRTYSLSAFFSEGEGSGYWGGPPNWRIATRSRIPKPGETICVVTEWDHRGHNINGWGISPYGPDWIDKLMIWDTGFFNFAYADGHVERYKWAGTSYSDPAPIEEAFMRLQTNVYYPGPDWDWISKRLFPGSRELYGDW
jgi:prepilin-type N-terminal cleavage/methylation domain-containing protein/prepilin-type processing-associated H-X9-DG protein